MADRTVGPGQRTLEAIGGNDPPEPVAESCLGVKVSGLVHAARQYRFDDGGPFGDRVSLVAGR